MNDLEQQLRDSIELSTLSLSETRRRLCLSTRALAEVTAALRDTMNENELLRAELELANLKLQARVERHLRIVGMPALLKPPI